MSTLERDKGVTYSVGDIEQALGLHFNLNDSDTDAFFELLEKICGLKSGQLLIKAKDLRAMYKKKRVCFTYGEYGHVDGTLSDVLLDKNGFHEALLVVNGALYRIGMDTTIIVDVEPQPSGGGMSRVLVEEAGGA
jgi:hypothetical protein